MAKYKIALMPGDGIGRVVLEEAIRVLEAAGFQADYVEGDIGWEFWCKEGDPLPKRTIELLEETDACLFGAITSKPKDKAAAELSPELRDAVDRAAASTVAEQRRLWRADRRPRRASR